MKLNLIAASATARRDTDVAAALVQSARNLSSDERYILHRLAAEMSFDLRGATGYPGVTVRLPVAEFAAQNGLRRSVAHRRLGAAAESLLGRWVQVDTSSDEKEELAWATSMDTASDAFELRFTGLFVWHLLSALSQSGNNGRTLPVALTAEDVWRTGATLDGKSVVESGRQQFKRKYLRQNRRKAISWSRLLHRVKNRLKKVMPTRQAERLLDLAESEDPWYTVSRLQFRDFNARDLDALFNWLIERKDRVASGDS
jgi:hypothetical protein